jgi:hypothetical protein
VVPLPAPVQPVFVLHDAVLIEDDDLQQHEAEQQQQQQPGLQPSEEQLGGGDGSDLGSPGVLQLQHGSPVNPALEQQQQEGDTGQLVGQQATGQQGEQRQAAGQPLEQREPRQQQTVRADTPGSSPSPSAHRQADAVGSKRRRRDSTGCAVG